MATLNKKIVLSLPPLMFDNMKRIAEIAGKSQQSIYRSAINAMISDPQLILSQERSRVEKSLSEAFPNHGDVPKETAEEYVEREWND